MEKTQISDWLSQQCEGYYVNTEFSEANAATIEKFLAEISRRFGEAVYCMPAASLHITLLDWISPLFDYDGQDKAKLYENVREQYDESLAKAVAAQQPFSVHFDQLKVFPNTIVLLGHDEGQFADIRQNFFDNIDMLPGSKAPPQIIHSSVVRFHQELDLREVEQAVAEYSIDFTQPIDNFRLIHGTREPLEEYEIIKRYQLGQAA